MKRGLLPILSAVFSLSFCLAAFGGVTADGDPVTNTTGEVAVLKGDAKLQSTLNAPINLKWEKNDLSRVSFDTNNDGVAYYRLKVYRDDMEIHSFGSGTFVGKRQLAQSDENGHVVWDIRSAIDESGEYKFNVIAADNDSDEAINNGIVSEFSEVKTYTKPGQSVAVPTNIRWSTTEPGLAMWDPVENADGYHVELYEDGEWKWGQTYSSLSDPSPTEKDFRFQIGNTEKHSYTFKVRAFSADLNTYAHSEYSEFSGPLEMGDMENSYEGINSLRDSLKTLSGNDASTAMNGYIDMLDKKDEQLKMQTDPNYRSVLKCLEDEYKTAANITSKITVDEDAGIDETKVSILGGSLNANSGDNVNFHISKANETDTRVLDPSIYSNVTRFDLNLEDASAVDENGNLRYPVEVTMPIPMYFKQAPFIYVIHYHHSDDGFDIIHPRVNDDYTISFTVTHFSEIAYATSEEGNGNDEPDNPEEGGEKESGKNEPEKNEPGNPVPRITVSDNKPMNRTVAERGDFKISYCQEIPFFGKSKIDAGYFDGITVSYNNAEYQVSKIKFNKKKSLLQITGLEGVSDKTIVKEIKKATKGANGLKIKINHYFVRDGVTPKKKSDGSVKSVKVMINGKDYKAKKDEWDYDSATKTITFKGNNLEGSVKID